MYFNTNYSIYNSAPIKNISQIQNKNIYTSAKFNQSSDYLDKTSFCGLTLQKVKDNKEMAKLAKLFIKSLNNNYPNDRIIDKIFNFLTEQLISIPFMHSVKDPDVITEIIYNNNKISGGYSFSIDKQKLSGHIDFLTLSDDLKRTKTGISALKVMADKIAKLATDNKLNEITWETEYVNIPARKLFSRFGTEKILNSKFLIPYIEYKIPTNEFIETLKSLNKNKN